MKSRSGQKLKLTSVEELLGVPNEEISVEIDIANIHSFKNHPFKVRDDEKMAELVESIRINGVLSPVLVRPVGEDCYEMISGHRRLHASQIVGLEMIPAIVREMTDDESIVAMVDSNIQREELLPSEKAFAYKMKLDAMKRQVGRPSKNNSCQSDTHLRSDEMMASEVGESASTIQRYIRLTELIPELLEMADANKIKFMVAVNISYLNQDVQKWLYEYIRENGVVKPEQITALRKHLEHNTVNQMQMIQVLNSNLKGRNPTKKVTLSENKLYKYFPPHYSTSEMEGVIVTLLEEWKQRQVGE